LKKPAIIAALEREIAPLVRAQDWQPAKLVPSVYRNYESAQGFIVCGGIGGQAARVAAEHLIHRVDPSVLVSAGVAGSLATRWKVGDVIVPATVVQSAVGKSFSTAALPERHGWQREGTLVSSSGIADPETKSLLAREYQADAVDMEAAAVAEVAAAHGIPFVAVKAISDECDFPLPDFGRFVPADGRFLTSRLVLYSALRPRMWVVLGRLAANTGKAAQELCRVLHSLLEVMKDVAVNKGEIASRKP